MTSTWPVLVHGQPDRRKGPKLPGAILRVLKEILGLADAPRQWYLRLVRTLTEHGWTKSDLDGAVFYFRDASGKLLGVLVAHVDDLFMGDKNGLDVFEGHWPNAGIWVTFGKP